MDSPHKADLGPAGDRRTYRRGCHCVACTRAAARYEQERQLDLIAGRPRMVDATGSRRRLHALLALGHTYMTISDVVGVHHGVVRRWTFPPLLNRRTAEKIATAYDELSMVLPREDTHLEKIVASRTRNRARANGWVPPLAWDDDTIDDPTAVPHGSTRRDKSERLVQVDHFDGATVAAILGGDWRLPATKADRAEVARRWHNTGRALNELGRLTGWKIERYFRATPLDEVAAS